MEGEKMNAFYETLSSVLEVPEVNGETRFRELPEWNSLKAFGLLVALENSWSTPLSFDDFERCVTARDLFLQAFITFAAEELGVERASVNSSTAYGTIPQWDSVAHLRLVMSAEKRFAVAYTLEQIPALKTLADFVDKI